MNSDLCPGSILSNWSISFSVAIEQQIFTTLLNKVGKIRCDVFLVFFLNKIIGKEGASQ